MLAILIRSMKVPTVGIDLHAVRVCSDIGRAACSFTKFLCNKEGKVIKRDGTSTEPSAIEQDIAAALA